MRVTKSLRADQEIIRRYLDALGGASVILGNSKLAQPDFFISAYDFISAYIENGLFKKEEPLLKALENNGFPADDGPVGAIRTDHQKSREAGRQMLASAKLWDSGDEVARSELVWAVSEYNSAMREHLDRIRNLIIPLTEQAFEIEEEQKIADEVNNIFPTTSKSDQAKYIQQVEALEEELSDWR
jgi:hemerythrin-like domain-containing protein